MHDKRSFIIHFLKNLRNEIVQAFETFEIEDRFLRKEWQHSTGGGGEISILRGRCFEKAAVNWSAVEGPHFPMQDGSGPFFATGVSLITHMSNPHAPTVHMNIRYIETPERFWFGGGFDLTPMGFIYPEDSQHFHQTAKNALDEIHPDLYPIFSQNAREYFYIPHRKKERGVGGLFFDHYNTGNFEEDLKLWQTVGTKFLDAILPIYQRRVTQPYSPLDKEKQLESRAHYVEFNLMYDRGTKFGFQSGGNPEAILCSMPPLAKW
ncbi:MAG: coproporphyrinogen III oxidase [Chlamydiales bacterium 38-26]|nr:oxygen-dependent coproporphyrinogen oxidase [Chlamydiales bacterium]OJV11561.1 MAG: coproporphyrinogen III oxidase [Chlamydiales bacterium 38-26]